MSTIENLQMALGSFGVPCINELAACATDPECMQLLRDAEQRHGLTFPAESLCAPNDACDDLQQCWWKEVADDHESPKAIIDLIVGDKGVMRRSTDESEILEDSPAGFSIDANGLLMFENGYVCDDEFGVDSAIMVCGTMGLRMVSFVTRQTTSGDYTLDELWCPPGAATLEACSYTTNDDCRRDEGIALTCAPPTCEGKCDENTHIPLAHPTPELCTEGTDCKPNDENCCVVDECREAFIYCVGYSECRDMIGAGHLSTQDVYEGRVLAKEFMRAEGKTHADYEECRWDQGCANLYSCFDIPMGTDPPAPAPVENFEGTNEWAEYTLEHYGPCENHDNDWTAEDKPLGVDDWQLIEGLGWATCDVQFQDNFQNCLNLCNALEGCTHYSVGYCCLPYKTPTRDYRCQYDATRDDYKTGRSMAAEEKIEARHGLTGVDACKGLPEFGGKPDSVGAPSSCSFRGCCVWDAEKGCQSAVGENACATATHKSRVTDPVCECSHGELGPQSDCHENGEENCSSCNPWTKLVGNKCKALNWQPPATGNTDPDAPTQQPFEQPKIGIEVINKGQEKANNAAVVIIVVVLLVFVLCVAGCCYGFCKYSKRNETEEPAMSQV